MWTHPLILAGLVTLALPVVIHLVLRSRPQKHAFPALRFVAESHQATARLARLKYIALLALRMAALALVVLILARPVDRPQAAVARGNVPAAKPENPNVARAPLRLSSVRPAAGSPTLVAVVRTAELPPGVSDAAGLVALALNPGTRDTSAVAIKIEQAHALADDKLKGDAAVFLADAAGVSPEGWAALEKFVADGGGLVVLLGRNVEAEIKAGHSSYLSAAAQQLLGGEIGAVREAPTGEHLTVPSYDVPALALFDAGRNGDLALPLVYRWFELRPAAMSSAAVKVGNIFPALLAATHGSGRVYVLATAPESGWSNLAGQAEFVILMHSLLAAAEGPEADVPPMALGQPATVAWPRAHADEQVRLAGMHDWAGALVPLLMLVLVAELFLANRFYRRLGVKK